jgi:anti-sigma-K factor RskA
MPSALNFPSNPTSGQQVTIGTRTFAWDGTAWRIYSSSETDPVLTQEEVQDFVAPLLNHSSHTNLTASYDDNANKIILTGTATISNEQIQDAVAPLFDHASHTNITASYDDENNKILLTAEEAGSTVTVSDTAPASPVEGNIWYNSSIAKLFIYYDNLWVEV